MSSVETLISEIHSLANPTRASISQKFFKTGKWEYAEGDIYIGLTVPQTRAIVKKYLTSVKGKKEGLSLWDMDILLADRHHEIRLAGILLLVHFAKDVALLPEVVEKYLTLRPGVNNWDLVDVSAPQIVGVYLQEYLTHEEHLAFIEDFLQSKNLWINRIIIVASFHQIKKGNGKLTLYIAERMLAHQHDLIHKAVGWMLREVGKRCSLGELRGFLDTHAGEMPRTMLRYAIERMEPEEREFFLKKK